MKSDVISWGFSSQSVIRTSNLQLVFRTVNHDLACTPVYRQLLSDDRGIRDLYSCDCCEIIWGKLYYSLLSFMLYGFDLLVAANDFKSYF